MDVYKKNSLWTPFSYPIFRAIWIAAVVSNIGTWMQEVAAAWMMTSLTTNPLLVALVQVASALPVFLLALPAGALADILDRRRYLLVLQFSMAIIVGLLALTTYLNWITPLSLLLYTFSLGIFYALNAPTWQATIPELVSIEIMPAAITLNSLSVNIARAIGPAIAGLLLAAIGPTIVFLLNALSFVGVIIALTKWKHKHIRSSLPAERLREAMRGGMRYIKGSPGLKSVLIITCVFVLFSSALWALLPLVTRLQLQRGPISYGILIGLLGLGAIIGALLLPKLRERIKINLTVQIGILLFAISSVLLAISKNFYIACLAVLCGGIAWITVLTSCNTVAQLVVAPWVRARAMSIYLIALFGGMAGGSALWGVTATHISIPFAFWMAALGLLICSALIYFFSLEKELDVDHTLTRHSPGPAAKGVSYHQGPTMVIVEYTVENPKITQFTRAMNAVRQLRLRNGAFFWELFNDINDENRFLECFMVESWVEHLRQHERISVSDRKIVDRVKALSNSAPQVSHFVAYDLANKYHKKPHTSNAPHNLL